MRKEAEIEQLVTCNCYLFPILLLSALYEIKFNIRLALSFLRIFADSVYFTINDRAVQKNQHRPKGKNKEGRKNERV